MTHEHILVSGAPGNVGSEVVRGLQSLGARLRVGAYDPSQAQAVFGPQTEVVHLDFLQPATYPAALAGVRAVFLVRPPALSDVARDIEPFLWAAVGAGVQRIVFLSIQGVENNKIVPHYKIEQAILRTGLAYTFLRASFFMQNLSTTHRQEIQQRAEIALPVGRARTSFVDVRDIAAVAVLALTQASHEGQRYTITGAEALDYDAVAAKLSQVTGRSIRYTRPSILGFLRRQRAEGRPASMALVMAALYTITRLGNASQISDDVARLLGRPPISFDQFAREHAALWRNTEAHQAQA